MNSIRQALFIITSDPRTSPRPAEAIRIAAGIGAWKRTEISIVLLDAAALVLTEFTDELVDGDNYTRYLPIIGEWRRPVYIQQSSPWLAEIQSATLRYEEISDVRLSSLAAASDFLLRF